MYPSIEEKQVLNSKSFFFRFSALMVFILLVFMAGMTLFFIDREKDFIYRGKIGAGEIILSHLARSAVIPLLEDDTLRMNALVQDAKYLDGFAYAAITDGENGVKAQTDPDIGAVLKKFDKTQEPNKDGTIISKSTLPSGTRVLSLSKPITFANKIFGAVYLGLSFDFLDQEVRKEALTLISNSLLLGSCAVVILMGTAFFLARRSNRALPDPDKSDSGKITGLFSKAGAASEGSLNIRPPRVMRDQVTVLFAGIKGFRSYAETRGPEGIIRDLRGYLTIGQNCILEYGGYVDKFVGGAVVGVFSSSSLAGDHTLRAIRAAVAMQRDLGDAGKKGNPLLSRVGIGISSGVVLSGPAGSQGENGYAFMGESLKAAYSLNVMATPGEIVISKDVYESIENFVSVEPLPPREIMQRTEPWENFRLLHLEERKNGG